MKLSGKTAVITGGNRDIGFAAASAFLKEGARVILTASRKESAGEAAEALSDAYPGAIVEGICPDLSVWEEVQEAFRLIYEKYGSLDILINNAEVSDSTPLEKYSEEIFDKVMDLNVKSVFFCSKAAVQYMEKHGRGVIINTSSVAGCQ